MAEINYDTCRQIISTVLDEIEAERDHYKKAIEDMRDADGTIHYVVDGHSCYSPIADWARDVLDAATPNLQEA